MRAVLLFISAFLLAAPSAQAQEYPRKPITLLVPFAPGGPTDTVARVTAENMGRLLGQPMVVENVAGAGGTVGAHRVVRASPDGYTLLLHHLGLATSVTLYRKLQFHPLKDLVPVGMVSDAKMAIIANPDYAPNTLAEVVADAKARGQEISIGNGGLGSASQLCGMLFMAAMGQQLTAVPFRGGGPVLQALLGGELQLGCEQLTTAAPLVGSNRVKAYAVTSDRRVESMPNVPTAVEAGLPDLNISVWHGIFAPSGTPEPVIQALSKALAEALKDPSLIERFAAISTEATPDQATPEALREMLTAEIDRWRPLIEAAGQYAD